MSSSTSTTSTVVRPVALLRSFFSPPAVTPTAGPVAWFAAQRSDGAWSDGAGRGDVATGRSGAAARGIDVEAADRGVDLVLADDRIDARDFDFGPLDLGVAGREPVDGRAPVAA